jgi:L,D-transpeptidase YcbB
MLRKFSLAACTCVAAALTAVVSGPAAAQSVDARQRLATVPQTSTEPAPVETMAPVPPERAAPVPADKAAPAPAESPAPAAAEMAPAAPVVEVDPLVVQVRQVLGKFRFTDSTPAERAALTAFYADRTALVWVSADGFTERARDAMAEIAKADDWGLTAQAFAVPAVSAGERSPAALADAEIKLSVAVLKYARHARGGRLDPAQVSRNFDQKLSLRDPKVVLETVAGPDTPGSYLRALHPKHPQFELLRQALIKARGGSAQPDAEAVVQLPDGPTLKLGMVHPDVALVRKRLNLEARFGTENLFDTAVQEAVAEYQRKNGMRPDGVLGARTRTALNGTDKAAPQFGSEEQRLIVNMERWRWMPEEMGEFHVWDNIPEFQTRVVRRGQLVHQAKIIVGRVETQTTIFSANMRYVIFGPEWGVPDSIKVKEILPYLRPSFEGPGFFGFGGGSFTDTRILEKHNLRVSYNGQPVDASQVDWTSVDIRKFNFIQPSGPTNVLGAVKFRFPNKHDIYMHDTPQRELFDKTVRTFSHGCVRVQNPGRLAEVLLEEDKGWSAARVRDLMAQGGNVEVTLTKQIPVHISYFTTVASEDGQVRSFGDVYGHDRRLAAALSGRPLPLEPPASTSPVADAPPVRPDPKESRRQQRRYGGNDDFFSGLFGN